MNPFQLWLDAVNKALANSGKKVTVQQLDPTIVQRAFQSGTSPVIFANQVQVPAPSTPTPHAAPYSARATMPLTPSHGIIKWTYGFLTVMGWLFWAVGGVWTLWAIVTLISASQSTGSQRGIAVFGAMTGVGMALGVFVSGAIFHYLAQRLAMCHYDFVNR